MVYSSLSLPPIKYQNEEFDSQWDLQSKIGIDVNLGQFMNQWIGSILDLSHIGGQARNAE